MHLSATPHPEPKKEKGVERANHVFGCRAHCACAVRTGDKQPLPMTHPFIFLRVMAEDYIHEDAALANLQDELEEKGRIIDEKTRELQRKDEELQEKGRVIDEKTRELQEIEEEIGRVMNEKTQELDRKSVV